MNGFIIAMVVLGAVELALFPEYRWLKRQLECRRAVRRVRAEMAKHIFWPLDDPDAIDPPSTPVPPTRRERVCVVGSSIAPRMDGLTTSPRHARAS